MAEEAHLSLPYDELTLEYQYLSFEEVQSESRYPHHRLGTERSERSDMLQGFLSSPAIHFADGEPIHTALTPHAVSGHEQRMTRLAPDAVEVSVDEHEPRSPAVVLSVRSPR